MKPATMTALSEAAAARQPVAFAKRLSDATELLLPNQAASAALNDAGVAALAAEQTGTVLIGDEAWFIEARNPAPRLIVVGGVHIAQALIPLAVVAGYSVILVDPRQGFGNPERFPNAEIMSAWPDTALDGIKPDRRTAIVTLTHDPKLDDPALDRALRTEAFFIGALGSRKTHAARLERLKVLGHNDEALRRVRGPVGLDIGAVSAAEIAISIIAELVAVRRNGGLNTREK